MDSIIKKNKFAPRFSSKDSRNFFLEHFVGLKKGQKRPFFSSFSIFFYSKQKKRLDVCDPAFESSAQAFFWGIFCFYYRVARPFFLMHNKSGDFFPKMANFKPLPNRRFATKFKAVGLNLFHLSRAFEWTKVCGNWLEDVKVTAVWKSPFLAIFDKMALFKAVLQFLNYSKMAQNLVTGSSCIYLQAPMKMLVTFCLYFRATELSKSWNLGFFQDFSNVNNPQLTRSRGTRNCFWRLPRGPMCTGSISQHVHTPKQKKKFIRSIET